MHSLDENVLLDTHFLHQGASFYGKRKSGFYGENDKLKKSNADVANAEEDYQGPTNSGYFVWRKNEDGVMQPQTRLKGKPLEKLIKTKEQREKK